MGGDGRNVQRGKDQQVLRERLGHHLERVEALRQWENRQLTRAGVRD